MKRPRPLVLVVLDGFGERPEEPDNAVRLARTPRLSALFGRFPHGVIGTSGPDVGLPPGQMGNSEVGHLNLGAGRIAMMDISRVDNAVFDGSLGRNPVVTGVIAKAKARGGRLHLLGLASDGGVHSTLKHAYALISAAHSAGTEVVVHAFLDGRDVQPGTAPRYLAELENALAGQGRIGTVCGRYWGMDRDARWERVERAYRAIVHAQAPRHRSVQEGLQASYAAKKTDEFVEPFVVGDYEGVRPGTDSALHFNFRPDRARELTRALALADGALSGPDQAPCVLSGPDQAPCVLSGPDQAPFAAFDRGGPAPFAGAYACMTTYDKSFGLPVAFEKETFRDVFPEVIARAGLKQLRCAETEKYAHVTYFFNGGREEPFEGEQRAMLASPKEVATYDLKPEMSSKGVADAVVRALDADEFDFILVNFANPDMVGHTGVLDAAIRAVEAVDLGVGRIWDCVRARGGAMLLTADHGNCEQMVDPATGQPHTAHTLNPVPFLYCKENDATVAIRPGGRLCDVAPTMLELLGIDRPKAMTGLPLLVR